MPEQGFDLKAELAQRFPQVPLGESYGQLVLWPKPDQWLELAQGLKELGFLSCMDLTGVDHLLDGARIVEGGVTPERFEVVAHFLAHQHNARVRAITQVSEESPQLDSLTSIYPGVNLSEREVFDLLGIEFLGHPDLTRIVLPDEWEGFPLRKDATPARVPVTFKGDPSPR